MDLTSRAVRGPEHADSTTSAADPARVKARMRGRILAARRADLDLRADPGSRAGPGARTGGEASPGARRWGRPASARAASALARRVLDLPEVAAARCVAAYVSFAGEPDTGELLPALHEAGKRILLPAIRPDLDLDFREYAGVLVPGAMGVFEPPPAGEVVRLDEADVVVVPALAADRAGRRLGRGGGCYDRVLGSARPAALVVALVHERELLDELPDERHDRRVGAVVTPELTWRIA
jgi:5-formyltetrahydrofolate cyclo-ligase